MQSENEPKDKKPTRRELFEQWKQNRDSKSLPKRTKPSLQKPMKFEDMLRNDSISFGRSRSIQSSKDKSSTINFAATSTLRKTASHMDLRQLSSKENNLSLNIKQEGGLDLTFLKDDNNMAKSLEMDLDLNNLQVKDCKIIDDSFADQSPKASQDGKSPETIVSEHSTPKKGSNNNDEILEEKAINISGDHSSEIYESPQKKNSEPVEQEYNTANKKDREDSVEKNPTNGPSHFSPNLLAPVSLTDQVNQTLIVEEKSFQNSSVNHSISVEGPLGEKGDQSPEKDIVTEKKKSAEKAGENQNNGDKTRSKKRKSYESETKEESDTILKERSNLKKSILNKSANKNKDSDKQKKIKIDLSLQDNSGSGKKKVVNAVIPQNSKLNEYGSGMKYSIVEIKKGKNIQRVVTPIRISKRLSSLSSKSPKDSSNARSKRKSHHENDSNTCSKASVKFAEDCDLSYMQNNSVEEIFKPVDEETLKIRELLKKRRPTPYSKSTKKTEESFEEDVFQENQENILETFDDENTFGAPREGKNQEIEVEKILDPNVRGNGNYALLELKTTSAKKIGTRRVITPLKDITNDKVKEATEDVKYVAMQHTEEDIGYIPRTIEVAKKLESFY